LAEEELLDAVDALEFNAALVDDLIAAESATALEAKLNSGRNGRSRRLAAAERRTV
jgi:hypothetical protein